MTLPAIKLRALPRYPVQIQGGDGISVVPADGVVTISAQPGAGFTEYAEIASPSNPAADNIRVFAKDVSGATHLFTRDSAGLETDLNVGAGGGSVADNSITDAKLRD